MSGFDPAQFKRLERAGYNRLGPRYLAGAAARQGLLDALLAAARLKPNSLMPLRVLDLASGPGLLAQATRRVIGDAGLVVASDISEGQLACCAPASAVISRVVADGESLPFADASFDRVLCGLGLMFFPDEQLALAEIRRVLRADGLLVASVWGAASEVPLVACALACMARLLPAPRVPRPSIFRLGDPDLLQGRLASADFSRIEIRPFRYSATFADAPAYWRGFLDLAGGAAESISRLPPQTQQQLALAVAEDLAPHAVSGGYHLRNTLWLAVARP